MQGDDLVGDGWSCDLVYHDVQALRRGGDVTLECTPRKVRAGGSGHLSIYGSRIEGYMSIYGNKESKSGLVEAVTEVCPDSATGAGLGGL